jgi:nucleotide-binding universal stress UspA family protein
MPAGTAGCGRDYMTTERTQRTRATDGSPVLLCFDGSKPAGAAIVRAGAMMTSRNAVVLTVWEPVAVWRADDPRKIPDAPAEQLAANAKYADKVSQALAREHLKRGLEIAAKAGFDARGRLGKGKPWREICAVAHEIGADPIVVASHGLGQVEATPLGSVSTRVVMHARRAVLVLPRP